MNINYKYAGLVAFLMIMFACTKMDHEYAPYLKSGELIYVGAPYDLETHPGRGRIEIQFTQSKDPNIVKYIIYWDNRKKQMEVSADAARSVQKVIITDLEERDYTFEIVALDKEGNTSTPGSALISGSSYGDHFESNLFTRGFTTENSMAGLVLNFISVDTLCKYTVIQYQNLQGKEVEKRIKMAEVNADTLKDFNPQRTSLKVISAYMPEKGIDTFYASNEVKVNLLAARFICTGKMVDVTNDKLTGSYPWNITLRQVSDTQVELYDEDYSKDIYHWILSDGGNSYYGQFGVVITLDNQNKVISVTNKYGQPSGNGRSGELDPSGINKFDPIKKELKVKYWMNQDGAHRTSFDEVMQMK